jgi:nitrite reductase/ring-hydroxylating ferredoxin subunit
MADPTAGERGRLPLWREEVSHEIAEERHVSRRQFGKFLMLTSMGMAAGNLWILVRSLQARPRPYPELVVARTGELPVGAVKTFAYPDPERSCILVRLDATRHVAYDQKCTHLSCPVIYRHDTRRLVCPCHNGHFDAETGAVLQGPPPRPLPRVLLDERGDELVAVGMAGEDEA